MGRLRQVPRSETDDPIVLGMYDLLFGKDVDPVTDDKMGTATGSEGDWWTTYALSPDIMEHAVAGFVMYRSPDRVVDGVLRGAQTRIGWCAGSKFVYSQHVQALRGLGADPAKIRDVTSWQTSDAYTRAERAVLAYADAIALDAGRVSDEPSRCCERSFSDEEISELTYISAMYLQHAVVTRALRLEWDDAPEHVAEVDPPEDFDAEHYVAVGDTADAKDQLRNVRHERETTRTAPAVGHEEVLARCATLADRLAAGAAEAEQLRRLPESTVHAAREADLFPMVVPRSLGGLGLGLDTLAQSTRILATGCPASAWTLSFLVMHSWLLTRLDPASHDELFGEHGYALAPAPLNPSGVATPVEDGYRLSGRWEWATGIEHSDWVLVHALIDSPGVLDTAFLVVPRDQVAVEDVWFTSGMRATGSNAVTVHDVVVPSRTAPVTRTQMMDGGAGRPDDPMAGYPVVAVLTLVAAAPALGAAEAAVEMFRARLGERVLAYTLGDKQADQPAARVRLATALAEVRAARAVWEQALGTLRAATERGAPSVSDRMDARLAAASTVRLARQAISTVCEGSGASVYAETSPLQRLQRDVEVLKGHVIFDWDRCAELAGRLALGQEPSPLDMV